jgi:3D-(3,5/4)-trihydroxycyclohexane-1,2-dione acylhydrolase (decyclizing)
LQRAAVVTGHGNEFQVDVDYVANAASMGCATFAARTEAELEAALREARAQERPAVVVCHVDPYRAAPASGAWWDLGVPQVAEDPAVAAAAAAHARGAERQRWFG